ncbi:formylglycine-generating enzyme family protein [Methanosarcina sp. Mfa9]|uniref:formylglycine-generating enzyme family protein n=1 Tax=Methanosarcina sp. Mfa9 TaxID=3439063 RepID=UPI003F824C74
MLRTRREERLRDEKQEPEPDVEEENSPNMYRDLKENVEVVEVVPAEGVAEKTEWMEKAEKTEMAEKADEIKKPEKTEMAGKAENEESELSSRPVISSSVSSKKASKSKPSGSPLMKILLLGIFFCVLLYGGWALMGGTEESSGNAEVAVYSGDAGDIGGVGDVGNDYEALSDPPQEPSSVSSDSSPEKVSLEKPQDSLDPPLNPPESFTNSLGMEFVLVPAGEFLMGSPETEAGRQADESPLHTVRLEKPFYMGKYEVTRAQWYEVMESAGEVGGSLAGDSEMPVAEVSWDDAQEFVKKLNEMEGTDKYRLPSEAEWEYACRAGSSTKYSIGDTERELARYAWFGKSSGSSPLPVGQKAPNAWGLYDMHGNVWEWARDSWHNDYNAAPSDGRAWESGELSHRIARGGSVTGSAESCRAANRAWFGSDVRNADMGFRLLMEV